MGWLIALIVVVIAIVAWWSARRTTQEAKEAILAENAVRGDLTEAVGARPEVASFHVVENEARVTFAVPMTDPNDEVMKEMLVREAVEVVREKSHDLPISGVDAVVAYAGPGGAIRVGEHSLETPGELPPPIDVPPLLQLDHIGVDPLERHFDSDVPADMPETTGHGHGDELPPLSSELQLPKAVDVGLRSQNIDPDTMGGAEMVLGLLGLFGYTVTPTGEDVYMAEKAGVRTYIRAVPHREGDYPTLDGDTIAQFTRRFVESKADRGMLVTEKYAPFEIYERERRDSRIRFVSRERLQSFVDGLSLG